MAAAEARPIILRGYLEQVKEDEWFGICLTLNLTVAGRSLEEASQKLWDLAIDYLDDASKEGDLDKMVPRRAPLHFYFRYLFLALGLPSRSSGDWELFSKTAPSLALNA